MRFATERKTRVSPAARAESGRAGLRAVHVASVAPVEFAKFRLGFLGLAGCAALLHAANGEGAPAALELRTERPDATFRRGEQVVFEARADQPEGKLHWVLSKDEIPLREGDSPLKDGRASITGSLDEPGFLRCDATLKTPGGEIKAAAGAAIDPGLIGPSLPTPEDFDAFWDENLRALANVPVNAIYTEVKSPRASVVVQDVRADSLGGPLSGYLAKPAGAKARSLPAILTLHGAGVRSSGIGSVVEWAGRGFLAMDINAHGIPNGMPDAYYENLKNGELRNYMIRGRESRETYYFRNLFLRVVRAIDVLCAQPEWNGKILVAYGSSQGGAQSLAAAALDKRVTFYVAAQPALCDPTGAAANRIGGWPNGRPGSKLDPRMADAFRYYDMVNFVRRIRAPGFFTVGFVDQSCHPTTVYAAFNAVESPKEIFNDITSPHLNSAEASRRMIQAVTRHVQVFPRDE